MKKRRKKRSGKKNTLKKRIKIVVLTTLLVFILLFLFLFKLDNIIVTGNSRYTEQEIKDYCINEGGFNNTLIYYLLHRKMVTDDVPLLDYVETAYVDRNTIRLTAHEKQAVGMFKAEDVYCCIDQEGYVIETVEEADIASLGVPVINGLCSEGKVGEKIKVDDERVLNALNALKSSFDKHNMTPGSIDIGENTDGEKTYTLHFGNITIPMGKDELLEEKMKRASAILPKLEGMSGTLHLEYYTEDTENIIFDSNAVG
ncbi:MAG: cell division protein FtsQ/DivIB [Lachnospiraceae bacterium]|nr:cell division protein FtsQ/DivIB [Lachnospiraceae bacterium]